MPDELRSRRAASCAEQVHLHSVGVHDVGIDVRDLVPKLRDVRQHWKNRAGGGGAEEKAIGHRPSPAPFTKTRNRRRKIQRLGPNPEASGALDEGAGSGSDEREIPGWTGIEDGREELDQCGL